MARKDPDHSLSDFCLIGGSAGNRLSHFERLTLTGGEELRRTTQRLAARFDQLPSGSTLSYDIAQLRQLVSTIEASVSDGALFPPSSCPETVERVVVHGLLDGQIEDISFVGGFCETARTAIPTPLLATENQRVHARWWRHADQADTTVIALHGWTMGDPRLSALTLMPGVLYRSGFDVVVVEMPLHGRRSPDLFHATALSPALDIGLANTAIGQAVADVRQLKAWLSCGHASRIGCVGVSLGGYVTALLASLENWSFVVPMVPAVDLAEIAWNILRPSTTSEAQGRELRDLLTRAFSIHSPLNHRPLVARDHIMIVAGLRDRVIPSRQPQALWEHWQRPEIRWHRGGHAIPFAKTRVFEEVVEFLRGLTGGAATP